MRMPLDCTKRPQEFRREMQHIRCSRCSPANMGKEVMVQLSEHRTLEQEARDPGGSRASLCFDTGLGFQVPSSC